MRLLKSLILLILLVTISAHASILESDQFKFQYIRGRAFNVVYLHSDRYQHPRPIFAYSHGKMTGADHEYSKTFSLEEMNQTMAQGLIWAHQDYSDSINSFFHDLGDYTKRLNRYEESLSELRTIISLPLYNIESALEEFEKKIDLKYPPKLKKTIWEKISDFKDRLKKKIRPDSRSFEAERDFFLTTIKRLNTTFSANKVKSLKSDLEKQSEFISTEKKIANNLTDIDQLSCVDTSWKIQVKLFNDILFGNQASPWKIFGKRKLVKKDVFDQLYRKTLAQISSKDCRNSLKVALGMGSNPTRTNLGIASLVLPGNDLNDMNRKGFEGLYDLLFYNLFNNSEHKPRRLTKNKLNKTGHSSSGGLFQVEAAVRLSNICKGKNDYLYNIWKSQEGEYTDRKEYLKKYRHVLRDKVRREVLLSSLQLEQEMLPILKGKNEFPAWPKQCPKVNSSNGDMDYINKKREQNQRWTDNYEKIAHNKKTREHYLYMIIEASLIKTLMKSYAWKDHLWPVSNVSLPEGNFNPWYPATTFPPRPGHMKHRLNIINQEFPLLRWRQRYDLSKPSTWSGFTSSTLIDKIMDDYSEEAIERILAQAKEMIKKNYLDLVAKINENSSSDGLESDENMSKWFQSTPKQRVLINRDQQRVLRSIFHFFSFQLPVLINKTVAQEQLISWKKLEPTIQTYYSNWKKHIENMRTKACMTDNKSLYESLPSLVLSHFTRDHNPQYADKKQWELGQAGQLDAYCNGPFGRTLRNVIEKYGPSVGTALFVAGTAIPAVDPIYTPSAKAVTYTTGVAIAAITSAMNVHKGVDQITTETALFKLSKKSEHEKDYGIVADAAKTALAAIFGRTLGSWISNTKGWRFFVPYKINWTSGQYMILFSNFGISTAFDILAHMDKGINPLTSKWFWMSRTGSFLSALLFAHAGDPSSYLQIPLAAVYNAMGQFYLYSEIELAFRNMQLIEHPSLSFVEFETLWQFGPNYITSAAVYSSNMFLAGVVPPKFVALAQFAISELEAYLSLGYYAKGKMNYLEDGLGFFESIVSVDFKEDLMRIREEAPRYKQNISQERIQASKEIFDSLPEENRKLLKEIFCINYGFQKLKQKMKPAQKSNDSTDSFVKSLSHLSAQEDPILKACELEKYYTKK